MRRSVLLFPRTTTSLAMSSGIQWDKSASLSHRFPVAVASQGCHPPPSSSLGGHHPFFVVLGATRIHDSVERATNGRLALGWPRRVAVLGVLVCVEREVHAGTAAQPVRLIVRHEPVRM